MKATKEQIKQWLDMQIGAMTVYQQRLTLTEKIDYLADERGDIVPDIILKNFSATTAIHIGNDALRCVATVMELPVTVIDREGDMDYRYELKFYYHEVEFFALESENEYKKNGELA